MFETSFGIFDMLLGVKDITIETKVRNEVVDRVGTWVLEGGSQLMLQFILSGRNVVKR